jgi:hypothetical protein
LKTFQIADSVDNEGSDEQEQLMYPIEYLNSINSSGLSHSLLKLKVGAPIMVLQNLQSEKGVCNGSRGILTKVSNHVLEVHLLGGEHGGETVFIPCITLIPFDIHLPFKLQSHQFPVKLAFAMIINKFQSQSVNYFGLDLCSPVFTHGWFYIAISQATSVHSIKAIWIFTHIQAITKIIIYLEVLLI